MEVKPEIEGNADMISLTGNAKKTLAVTLVKTLLQTFGISGLGIF